LEANSFAAKVLLRFILFLFRMKKLVPLFLAMAILATACAGQGSSGAIKIGVIAPMTGDAAVYGQQMQAILDYALVQVNAEYLDSGTQFELIYGDGQCGAGAATAFQKLSDVDGVKYVIGGACSSESLAMAPLLAEKQVIALSPLSSSPELDGLSPNLMSLSYSDSGVADGIALEMSKYSKVAFLNEQNDYNMAFHDNVWQALQSYPTVEVVADETIEKGATDFRNALQKIKESNPEVVFFNTNVGVTSESMLKQLAELSDWEVAKVGTFPMMDDSYIALAPEMMEGMIGVDTPKINTPEFKAMSDAVLAANPGATLDDLGAYYTASTYDALTTLAKAIVDGKNTYENVLNELQTGSFSGYIGAIRFDSNTFVQGIGTAVYKVVDGVWTLQ
jgi:branched-chain amino acid transport system substrate-binding protein